MLKIVRITIFFFATVSAIAFASESPTESSVAFFAEHEGGLYLFNTIKRNLRKLDVGLSNIGNLSYSANLNLLAFEGTGVHGQLKSLYLLDLINSKKELIYKAKSNHSLYRPEFTPDGQHLYAVNYSSGIHKFSFADRTWEKTQVSGVENLNPQRVTFSESGRKAAISPGDFGGFLIADVENNSFIVKGRVLDNFDSCISPRWIGENTIVFAGRKNPGLQFIWKLDISTGAVTQITHSPIAARDFLSVSKRGDKIIFTGTTAGTTRKFKWRLWQVGIDGSGLSQLTKGGELSSHLSPVWIE